LQVKRHRTNTIAAATLCVGAALLTIGVAEDRLPETITGFALTVCAALAISLHVVHRWITNTAQERDALHEATLRRDDERAKYLAGQYAVEAELKRIRLDAVAAARRADKALQAERVTLHAAFEEKRAALISQTLEAAVQMIDEGGLLDAPRNAERGRTVLPFPAQPADHERARGRDITSS